MAERKFSLWGRNMLEEEDFGGFGPASSFWFNAWR